MNPTPVDPLPGVKSHAVQLATRHEAVLQMLLVGARRADVLRYASEQGWNVSSRTVENYIAAAHAILEAQADKDRDRVFRLHLAQRQELYARAVNSGDLRAALAVVKDTDELLGYYPQGSTTPAGPAGPLAVKLTVEVVHARADGADPAAPGPGGLPPK